MAQSVSELESELSPPEQFSFPFEPYNIQKDFMKVLYTTLERGQVGIFESPTGTGKSLSIICGALRWLFDREQKDKEILTAVLEGSLSSTSLAAASLPYLQAAEGGQPDVKTEKSGEPDWFASYDQKKAEREAFERLKAELERRKSSEARLKKLREERAFSLKWRNKRKREPTPPSADIAMGTDKSAGSVMGEDADIVVAEYLSDEDETKTLRSDSDDDKEEEAVESDVRKIYYCSRTHTQLAQFVREVQKSPYSEDVQVITLGSRQNLCINSEVTGLKSLALMNDRCLDMQKSKKTKDVEKKRNMSGQAKKKQQRKSSSSSASCPFYKPGPMETFRDLALTKVQDIEQLVVAGKEVKACPYYGVRRALPAAQLVVLPYNTLLHGPTRDAVGVTLRGNVVIVDEAHNLLDTISSVYSVRISGSHVTKAHSQLSQYLEKYRARLKAKNLMYINQISQVLRGFLKMLQVNNEKEEVPPETRLVRLNDFLFSSNMDNVNMFKILRYCEKSLISRKLNGFVERYCEEVKVQTRESDQQRSFGESSSLGGGGGGGEQMKSPLMLIESFLQALTNMDTNGRIVITRKESLPASSLKFLLLNPSVQFAHIVKEARAVVVAGGTMQPADELKDQLLTQGGMDVNRLVEFSCGHVIPPHHLLPVVLCKGPAGEVLEFSFQSRDRHCMMDELGRSIVNLCTIIPGGVVCFFPSYEYENKVYVHWEKAGVLDKIKQRKKIFREPKHSSEVERVLSQYGRHIQRCVDGGSSQTGSLLLCVVGGKLSEGINFSDDLGRCVVMVGLPYPNITSPELKEKMAYLNSTMPRHSDGRLPGQIHYESLCMKAVNQSIGRAIRHSRDYACIVLADMRYDRPSVIHQLPQWISKQLLVCKTFGLAFASIRKFFIAKKTEQLGSS